jgi:hypothetical protein
MRLLHHAYVPRPLVKAQWSDADELKAAARARAVSDFTERFDIEWQDSWGDKLRQDYGAAEVRDREAQRHITNIREAICAARRFASNERLSEPEEIARAEGRDAPVLQLVSWLDEEGRSLPSLGEVPARSFRTYLVARWYAALNGEAKLPGALAATLRSRDDANEFFWLPTDHEFALISVLCGTFPAVAKGKLKNITATKFIDDEAGNMGNARESALGSKKADPAYAPNVGLRLEAKR